MKLPFLYGTPGFHTFFYTFFSWFQSDLCLSRVPGFCGPPKNGVGVVRHSFDLKEWMCNPCGTIKVDIKLASHSNHLIHSDPLFLGIYWSCFNDFFPFDPEHLGNFSGKMIRKWSNFTCYQGRGCSRNSAGRRAAGSHGSLRRRGMSSVEGLASPSTGFDGMVGWMEHVKKNTAFQVMYILLFC